MTGEDGCIAYICRARCPGLLSLRLSGRLAGVACMGSHAGGSRESWALPILHVCSAKMLAIGADLELIKWGYQYSPHFINIWSPKAFYQYPVLRNSNSQTKRYHVVSCYQCCQHSMLSCYRFNMLSCYHLFIRGIRMLKHEPSLKLKALRCDQAPSRGSEFPKMDPS